MVNEEGGEEEEEEGGEDVKLKRSVMNLNLEECKFIERIDEPHQLY